MIAIRYILSVINRVSRHFVKTKKILCFLPIPKASDEHLDLWGNSRYAVMNVDGNS